MEVITVNPRECTRWPLADRSGFEFGDLHSLAEDIKNKLQEFHSKLNTVAQIKERPEEETSKDDSANSKSAIAKIFKVLFLSENSETPIEMSEDTLVRTENENIMQSIEGSSENSTELAICQNEKHHSRNFYS